MKVQTRFDLRIATHDLHARLDDALSHLRLNERSDYAALLRIHARVIPDMERRVATGTPWSEWAPRAGLLNTDIIDLGLPPPPLSHPSPPTTAAARWGLQYVLEGSRLGGAMLARQVGGGFPKRYLCAPQKKGAWSRFQSELQEAAQAEGSDWAELAATAARSVFERFEQALSVELGQARGR